jgi:hypothetical protein
MVMRYNKSVFKLWNLQCGKCKNYLHYLAWDYDVPTNCRCGGIYTSSDGDTPVASRPQLLPASTGEAATCTVVSTTDAGTILDDLRWQDTKGG